MATHRIVGTIDKRIVQRWLLAKCSMNGLRSMLSVFARNVEWPKGRCYHFRFLDILSVTSVTWARKALFIGSTS